MLRLGAFGDGALRAAHAYSVGLNAEDWYAIDSYNPIDGSIHRLFVGTEEDAAHLMQTTYAVPTTLAEQPFYRCCVISTSDALDYFNGISKELDERGVYSVTEVAGMLDVSRQRVLAMLKEGKLEGHKVGSTWNVYRFSVEARMAQ